MAKTVRRAWAIALLLCVAWPAAAQPQGFGAYRVPVYRGAKARPNFTGSGRAFRDFRTLIARGFAGGVNFAGHYALIRTGCGTDCTMTIAGDIKTGDLFDFPLGGEAYYDLDLRFMPDSRLVVARWSEGFDRRKCFVRRLVLVGKRFQQIGKDSVGRGPCPAS